MTIKYLKKATKTSSTDDQKTRDTVEKILKDLEKSKENGCIELTKKFDKYEGEIIVSKEKIGIFGDYDVDGATSTALLVNYFHKLGQFASIYIPDRKKEGYGPSKKSFDRPGPVSVSLPCLLNKMILPMKKQYSNTWQKLVLQSLQADPESGFIDQSDPDYPRIDCCLL